MQFSASFWLCVFVRLCAVAVTDLAFCLSLSDQFVVEFHTTRLPRPYTDFITALTGNAHAGRVYYTFRELWLIIMCECALCVCYLRMYTGTYIYNPYVCFIRVQSVASISVCQVMRVLERSKTRESQSLYSIFFE